MTDVDTTRLKAAAAGYSKYGDQFRDVVAPAINRCQLPWDCIPVLGMGFGHTYGDAWQQMDLSIRAMPDLLNAIGGALQRVAEHYEGQDIEIAKSFTPPGMPAVRSMDGTSVGDYIGQGATALGTAGTSVVGLAHMVGDLKALRTVVTAAKAGSVALQASVLPFGWALFAAVLATDAFAWVNMREPMPYFDALNGLSDVESVLNAASADLPQMCYDVVYKAPKWTGAGAEAFYAFVNDDLDKTLTTMVGVNNEMQTACREAGWSMTIALITYLGISAAAAIICDVAKMIPDPTTVTQQTVTNAALAGFLAYSVANLLDLAQMFVFLQLAAGGIKQQSDTLKAYLTNQQGELDGRSLRLSVTECTTIASWENSGWVQAQS